jgi:hypothetical protein
MRTERIWRHLRPSLQRGPGPHPITSADSLIDENGRLSPAFVRILSPLPARGRAEHFYDRMVAEVTNSYEVTEHEKFAIPFDFKKPEVVGAFDRFFALNNIPQFFREPSHKERCAYINRLERGYLTDPVSEERLQPLVFFYSSAIFPSPREGLAQFAGLDLSDAAFLQGAPERKSALESGQFLPYNDFFDLYAIFKRRHEDERYFEPKEDANLSVFETTVKYYERWSSGEDDLSIIKHAKAVLLHRILVDGDAEEARHLSSTLMDDIYLPKDSLPNWLQVVRLRLALAILRQQDLSGQKTDDHRRREEIEGKMVRLLRVTPETDTPGGNFSEQGLKNDVQFLWKMAGFSGAPFSNLSATLEGIQGLMKSSYGRGENKDRMDVKVCESFLMEYLDAMLILASDTARKKLDLVMNSKNPIWARITRYSTELFGQPIGQESVQGGFRTAALREIPRDGKIVPLPNRNGSHRPRNGGKNGGPKNGKPNGRNGGPKR